MLNISKNISDRIMQKPLRVSSFVFVASSLDEKILSGKFSSGKVCMWNVDIVGSPSLPQAGG